MSEEKAKKPAKKAVSAQEPVPAAHPPVGSAARKAMVLKGLLKE